MTLELNKLQQKHNKFSYDSFDYKFEKNQLRISWQFSLSPNISFQPKLSIPIRENEILKLEDQQTLENLIFHLGLIEMISYWKVSCAPQIDIKAGYLDPDQIKWWKKLFINGLGEFFYTNQIDFTVQNFVNITIKSDKKYQPSTINNTQSIIIPIGGGKDSIVSAEILKNFKPKPQTWALNPIPASYSASEIAGYQQLRTAKRTIDPLLFDLNKNGYLNGHTPFSAYLAFFYALAGWITGSNMIVLSNERSANEANTTFHGRQINHQYSKSFEFENDFRQYSQKYLLNDLEYLSFLRPLHELQIAQIFAKYSQHFTTFRSCNVGQKQGIWCHHCSKCLFAFLMIFPFVEYEQIVGEIFDDDLFTDDSLIETALKLVKPNLDKPFDCVGSYHESKLAFHLAIKKYQQENRELPLMLKQVKEQVLDKEDDLDQQVEQIIKDWNKENNLTKRLKDLLKNNMSSRT